MLVGAVAVLNRDASAHHPEISVSARCGTANPVLSWTARSWITYDSPHAYNPDIEVDILLGSGSWQQIGRGAFNLQNSFQFTGTYDLPTSASGAVQVRAIAIAPFGLAGEFGSAGTYRIASVTVPTNCSSGGSGVVCGGSLGAAGDYNLFVSGDVNLSASNVDGRVAAGGNVTLNTIGVGGALAVSSSRIDLAAAGVISGSAVNVKNGSVNFGVAPINGVAAPHGVIAQADGSWIATSFTALTASSKAWGAVAPNMPIAWVNPSYKTLELVGTDPKTNVFSIPASDLATAREIHLKAPTGATVLVNVTGATYNTSTAPLSAVAFWNGANYSQYAYPTTDANAINYRTQVLWNFPTATSLQLGPALAWEGSVLAPYAAVTLPGGQLNGELIAGSATSAGAPAATELHPFKPAVSCLPPGGSTTPPTTTPTTPPTGPTTPTTPTTPPSGTTAPSNVDPFCSSYGSVAGSVFEDHNANGVRDGGGTASAADRGLAGVVATAYDSTGAAVGSATTSASGTYKISITSSGSTYLRIVFTNFPAGYWPGVATATGGEVQFVRMCDTNVDFALQVPSHYCQDNPDLAAACQRLGASTKPVVMTQKWGSGWDAAASDFAANVAQEYSTGYPDGAGTTTAHPVAIPASTIGSVSALAWRPATRTIYAAAYVKTATVLGPGGASALYSIPLAADNSAAFANVVSALPGTAGGNPTIGVDGTPSNFDDAGRTGLGGIELVAGADASRDVLYVVGLADRKLYAIGNLDGSKSVTSTALPLDLPGAGQGCPAADVRPFALAQWNGELFAGMVCTAESTQDASAVRAYVYRFTPGSGFAATPSLEFPLTYNWGELDYWGGTHPVDQTWQPWSNNPWVVAHQPMLTGLAIAEGTGAGAGNLVVGLRSRAGELTPAQEDEWQSDGDLLLATKSASGWTIESDLNPTTHGEYFFEDGFPFHPRADGHGHFESSRGAVATVPGFADVASMQLTDYHTSGIAWQALGTGRIDRAMSLFVLDGSTDTFGKANALGDLVALCDQAPIEIGDRVWADVNDNGIQDADEHGLPGVQVKLMQGTTIVASATTDGWGEYSFPKLPPNTAYQIVVDEAQAAIGTAALAKASQGSDPQIDSNANEFVNGTTKTAVISLTTGSPGANDHGFDIGFVRPNPGDPVPRCTTCVDSTVVTAPPPKTAPPVTFFNP